MSCEYKISATTRSDQTQSWLQSTNQADWTECPMAFSITSCKAAVLFALAVLSVHSILPIAAAPVPPTSSSPERDLYLGLKALSFYVVSESSRIAVHAY